MEEKLYFAPANYGKGRKHSEKSESLSEHNKKEKSEKSHKVIKMASFLLFLVIIVIIIIWLLHGKTTTTGRYPENIHNDSLECVSNNIKYEKTSSIESSDSELKITTVFRDNGTLGSISLLYTLTYQSSVDAYSAEARAHAEFNKGLAASGFSSEKFANKFTLLDNKLLISLYATSKEINEYTYNYFLIDSSNDFKTLEDIKEHYKKQGFVCAINK
ncbi:hypothetical protein IKL45_02575 [Candidatus Saccharibacteria bacterium]|nr:hypothetical protein [Candidatus Saccharibacteria bacterium]MBR6122042.1 hypothetical protein [Candidatus Saccharibacteria bacterium]